jgi:hypothetical protein
MINRLARNPAETNHRGGFFVHRAPFERRPPDTLELKRPPFCPRGYHSQRWRVGKRAFSVQVLGKARGNHSCLRNRQLSAPTYLPGSPPTESTIEFSNPEKGSYLSTSCSGRTSTARIFARSTSLEEDETHSDSGLVESINFIIRYVKYSASVLASCLLSAPSPCPPSVISS